MKSPDLILDSISLKQYLYLSECLQHILPRLCLHFRLNLLLATFLYRTIVTRVLQTISSSIQSFKQQPLDAKLARFSFPWMYSQSFTFEFCLVSTTLFSTNCLYFLSVVFIHVRTTCESVKQTSELMVVNCCNALSTVFINLPRISAPNQPTKVQPQLTKVYPDFHGSGFTCIFCTEVDTSCIPNPRCITKSY